jgi:signal transduction histidine kinase/ActR/RegA family two-component response regulator
MRLRSHLVALVLAALVPVLGFAALVIRDNTRLQLAATERGMRETAHAVARTVDKQLETATTALQALGESQSLHTGDLARFHALCQRVAHAQGWVSILLFDTDGRGLMHTAVPLGTALPSTRRRDDLDRARNERRVTVSNLFDGVRHPRIVAVYVPVVRDGVVRFVLSAGLPAARFSDVLRAQQFGPGSVAALQDRDNVVVARTQGEAQMVGQRVRTPAPGREGWTRSRLREGAEVYVAFSTAPVSGWRVVLTVPVEAVHGPLRRGLWQLLAGAALAAALAAILTFVFGRRIAGAVGSLVRIARAVERGDPIEPLCTGVAEVNVLAEQLRAAADLARAREQEVAVRERQARAIAEVAHALSASIDLDTVLRTAMETGRQLVQADSARIALVDDDGRLVLRYSTRASTAMPAGFVIERGHGVGGVAWATGHPVRTDDFAADPRFSADRYLPIARADGVVSCMAVPITTGRTVVGVIYTNNLTRRPFTAADETALVTLADHAAVAVEKARLLAGEHAARAEAEAASRGKDELLAMLGHELRNPLAAIANAAHVLDSADAPEESARRAREIIARQNAHLARLVDDLLDVARVTSGKIALARRPVELAEAIRRGVATLAASGRAGRHRISLDLHPAWADADETRMEQVVTNLVGNALRFTPPDGTVDLTLRLVGGDAVLTVRDSGVGIAPEMLPRVFDVFVQGARVPDGGHGGLGLGLTLVRRIVELHGGSVEAASDGPGRGSTFTVRLPALATPPAPAPTPGPGRTNGGRRRRIVIVEDNADAREMLRVALELQGHELHEAHDGPSGLAAILRWRPDVALIDVGLPGYDGYEVVRQVRMRSGSAIRLVALTGYGQPDDWRQALQAGFDAHLVKPVEPGTLQAAMETAGVEPRNG